MCESERKREVRSESSCRERGDNKYINKGRGVKRQEREERSEKDRQMIQNGERSVRERRNTDKMDSRLKIEIKRAGR